MKDNRTRRSEVRMEPKRVVVDLQQLDLLEQKIVKATELIRSLRREREATQAKTRDLEKALAAAQAQATASEKGKEEMRELSEQLDLLREERQTIRGRVSQMLELMAGLEEGGEARREH
jgi:uncharacterized coiled-coil DUF342 family protein